MPTIPLHLPSQDRQLDSASLNPLPSLLHTPSGLAILELQGSINTEPNSTGHATDVGRLVFPHYSKDNPSTDVGWMKTVHLYVGRHQRLTGEVKKITNPLAVIRRRIPDGQGEPDIDIGEGKEELEIVEVIYHKIVFSSRPEPVGDLPT